MVAKPWDPNSGKGSNLPWFLDFFDLKFIKLKKKPVFTSNFHTTETH
jgi:hypothetical protein